MKRVESDGEAGGARKAVPGREHARRVENQQRVREVSRTKNPDTDKQAAEGNRKRLQTKHKRTLGASGDRPFAYQQPEACNGNEAGKKCPEKDSLIGVMGGFEKPERSERANDCAERVH